MAKKKKRKTVDRMKRPEYDRLVFDVLHSLKGISAASLAKQSFLSASTISKIRRGPAHGGTRHPWGSTLDELARLSGGEMRFVARVNAPSEPKHDTKLLEFKPRRRA
jgi:transcriptional regulator with XRE-family HTH domain